MGNMDEKRAKWVTAVATPLLQPGEPLEMTSVAQVGSVSVARKAATAAVVGALTGGMVVASVRPRAFYLALTDQRLLFFGADRMSGRPEKKLAMQIPRAALRAGEPKRGLLTATVMIEIAGQDKGLKFVFPRKMRDDAPGFVARLNGALR